ncbi:hypothetical protein CES86_3133 [Brucella lupini]|uniref:Uncharacterized protein n=1 Tax=Brucella lupini TaxID=255457 RepID=A0A256GJJ0_9HYPH|nr:hypothetical protein CES86_3133 [Brucella lupini]
MEKEKLCWKCALSDWWYVFMRFNTMQMTWKGDHKPEWS